ncbi:MAG TPA: hypothetical protein DIS79_08250, partial [Bacteroidetes bacterium]|nr:hypothetical protein [Bacteroidota bacterium]
MRISLFLATGTLLLSSSLCFAATPPVQEETAKLEKAYRSHSFGAFGGATLNNHTVDLKGLPDIPTCCSKFENGTGLGFAVGGLFDYNLGDARGIADGLSIQARLAIMSGPAALSAEERTTVNTNGTPSQGVFQHSLDVSRIFISAEPLLAYQVFGGLQVLAGPSLGLQISSTFEQEERLLEPSDAVYENDQKVRLVYSGSVPQSSTVAIGVTGGVRYAIDVNASKTMAIVPEVFYTIGLNNLQQSQPWTMNSLRAGVAVQWNTWVTLPPPPPP